MTATIIIGLLLLIAAALIPPLAIVLWSIGGILLASGAWLWIETHGWEDVWPAAIVVVILLCLLSATGKMEDKADLEELQEKSKVSNPKFCEEAGRIILECKAKKISKDERNKRLSYLISRHGGKAILDGQFAHVPDQIK